MGTLFAIVAVVASFALVVMPVGTVWVFWALGIMLLGLAGAAFVNARPGWMSAASLLGWFAAIIVQPFAISRAQERVLERAVRNEDQAAQALLDFYRSLAPWADWTMLAITLLVVALYVVAARRDIGGEHRFMLDESNALATLAVRTGIVASLLFAPMMLIIVYDVLQRKFLDIVPTFTDTGWYQIFTSTRIQEMEWHLHAVLFLMCFAYAYIKDAHVRIELVRDSLRPRARVWVELLGTLLFLVPYCYVILKFGTDNAMRAWQLGEASSAQTGLPYRFIIKAFMPLGFSFLALAGMSVALKCIVYLFGPHRFRDEAGYHAGAHHAGGPTPADA